MLLNHFDFSALFSVTVCKASLFEDWKFYFSFFYFQEPVIFFLNSYVLYEVIFKTLMSHISSWSSLIALNCWLYFCVLFVTNVIMSEETNIHF